MVALGGCGLDVESDFETGADELRALTPAEILGVIAPGEQRFVDYDSSVRFRAFQFQGTAGTRVSAAVTSTTGDAVLWITDQDFVNLAYNEDDRPGSLNASVELTLPETATYYLAFRDENLRPHRFQVWFDELEGPTPDQPCNPDEDVGCEPPRRATMFDDALLSATPLTAAELRSLLGPGARSASVGDFVVAERRRNCTSGTGAACGAWVEGVFQAVNRTTWTRANLTGTAQLLVQSTRIQSRQVDTVRLGITGSVPGAFYTSPDRGLCATNAATEPYCGQLLETRQQPCYETTNYQRVCPTSPWPFTALPGGTASSQYPRFHATNDCVYFRQTSRLSSGNSTYSELEIAFYARLRPNEDARLTLDRGRAIATW